MIKEDDLTTRAVYICTVNVYPPRVRKMASSYGCAWKMGARLSDCMWKVVSTPEMCVKRRASTHVCVWKRASTNPMLVCVLPLVLAEEDIHPWLCGEGASTRGCVGKRTFNPLVCGRGYRPMIVGGRGDSWLMYVDVVIY